MHRRSAAIIFILFLIIPFSDSFAQADVKIRKKEFKLEKEGFSEAWKNIESGDQFYNQGGGLYREAVTRYKMALLYNPENPELNYKAGVSCLYGDMADEALTYLMSAFRAKPEVAPDILLVVGLAYQSDGDFESALEYFKKYSEKLRESGEDDQKVKLFISQCNLAINLEKDPSSSEVVNMGAGINSEADDYSPSITSGDTILYFTSRRNIFVDGTRNQSDMKYDESIFRSTLTGGTWDLAGIAGKNIATDRNEGILFVSDSNDIMYVYAGWTGNGDIYVSEFSKGQWTRPRPLTGGINSEARETSFSITGNGDERFFTSDRKKDGMGGRDIWYVRKIDGDKWTKPFNLGPDINSPGNEESVWVSSGGDTLWFSSNGHKGIGGYDIFVSFRDSLGIWSVPQNLGIPVNSTWDDLFFRPLTGNNNRAFITSNRPGGIGGFDIYEVIVTDPDTTNLTLPGNNLIIDSDTIALPAASLLNLRRQLR